MFTGSILLAAWAAAAHAGDGGRWVPLASMSVPRQEVGGARIGNEVYVVGGLVAGPTALATVEAYDIGANSWSTVRPLPEARDHAMVAALDGLLYAIGGFQGDFAATSTVYVYDPVGDAWTTGPPLPEPVGAGAAVQLGARIYLFGGTGAGGAASAHTWIFDPLSGWSAGADLPLAREHLTAATVGPYIHVVGGRDGASTDRHDRYDPALDRWDTLAPMPTPRSAMGTAALGGQLVVSGGEVPVLASVTEVYDPATDTWTEQRDMPVPRHGVAAVALDDSILMAGGGTVQGIAPSAVVDAFTPGPSLRASGACPGTVTLSIAGASPSGAVAFGRSSGPGVEAVPIGVPCAGVGTALAGPLALAGVATAAPDGSWSAPVELGPALCGATAVQALDLTTCVPGNRLDF